MEWNKKRWVGAGNPSVVYSSEYNADDIAYGVGETIVFVNKHISHFSGCSYLVYMWDSVNAMLVVFGETESGDLSEHQVETVFLVGQKLLAEEAPPFDLLDAMAEEVRCCVISAVKELNASLNPELKVCFLFDRSSSRDDFEFIQG